MKVSLVLLCLSLAFAACAAVPGTPRRCDLWIRGGEVVDGSGSLARRADVLVAEGRIIAMGSFVDGAVLAAETIDATGCVVTPGFIDVHAHGDPLRSPRFANFRAMGVTTICLGMDGGAPSRETCERFIELAAERSFGVNIVPFVGHGAVRREAGVGHASEVTAAQCEALAGRVRTGLDAGAFGLTTGLEYEPGRFARMPELVAVAEPVAAAGGVVMSHVRNEDDAAIEASIAELLEQCGAAGCAAHVSHLKIVYGHGAARAQAVLAQLAAARSASLPVTADLYPYVASYTGIGIVFPEWARPPHDYEAVRAERRAELADYLRRRVAQRNGPTATVFGSGPFAGRSLAQAAAAAGKPFEALLIDDVGPGGASAAYFVMASDVMERFLIDPYVMIASDGSPTMRHPRGHGTFAKVIREHVVERGLLSLEEAVRKMTGLPAATLGLTDRGRVAVGAVADLLVFDPTEVRDHATFAEPFRPATGFRHVLIGGSAGADAGRLLRRSRRLQ